MAMCGDGLLSARHGRFIKTFLGASAYSSCGCGKLSMIYSHIFPISGVPDLLYTFHTLKGFMIRQMGL